MVDATNTYDAHARAFADAVPALSTTSDFIRFINLVLLQTRADLDHSMRSVPLTRIIEPQLRLTSRLSAWVSEYKHRPEEAAADSFPEALRAQTTHWVTLNQGFASNLARLNKMQRNHLVTTLEHVLPLLITLEILPCTRNEEDMRAVLQHLVTPSLVLHPEFLFALPENAIRVLARVPPREGLGAETLHADQLQGRQGVGMHLQAAIMSIHDDVSRALVQAVLDGNTDALLAGIEACDRLLSFFRGGPTALPTRDVLAFDGAVTMQALLSAVDRGAVTIVADENWTAVLDARADDRRFFIVFPGDVAAFTLTVTFGAQDAYRARPLAFALAHREEMPSSLLVRYTERDRAALQDLRQRMLMDEQWRLFTASVAAARQRAMHTVPLALIVTVARYALHHRLRQLGLDDDLIDALLDGLLEILKHALGG